MKPDVSSRQNTTDSFNRTLMFVDITNHVHVKFPLAGKYPRRKVR